ncbi:MAG TPA: V-type ATP synthase subunit I [Planctomycetaceae bacterium]|nr:V-type ATP synthase subunit I [Planctomycetaceae bacterium]
MAIVKLDKLTLFGTTSQKDAALAGLQELGCLHLIPLDGSSARSPKLVSTKSREALSYLDSSPQLRRPARPGTQYSREQLVEEVLSLKRRRQDLVDERDDLKEAIEALEPWGDFQLPSREVLAGQQLWFYVIPNRRIEELPNNGAWAIANSDGQSSFVVAIGSSPSVLPFRNVQLDDRSLSHLRGRLDDVEHELDDLYWQRVTLSRWRKQLRNDLDQADDRAAQLAAASVAADREGLFALQGWVPRRAVKDVKAFCELGSLALTIEPPTESDRPPTLLNNPQRVAGAEGCVTFYITPGYHAWDPTAVVFFSFSLFFAMIIADAGYGLLLGIGLALFWRSLGKNPQGRRFRGLAVGLISFTVVYGMLVGSYFGVEPFVGSWLDHLRIRIGGQPMMENQNAMMTLSVAIGVAHLALANLISAWQARRSLRCLGHFGWSISMIAGFLVGAGTLLEISQLTAIGIPGLYLGGVCILLFSSTRPLLTINPKTHALRLMDGIMQIPNLSKAFGDVLSYLRLFALGLASAQLAITFNDLATKTFHSGGAGVALALLIIIVGHSINFLLGLMGGVVHGLRLNCIEFFNWSLQEEGYPFQPFARKAKS